MSPTVRWQEEFSQNRRVRVAGSMGPKGRKGPKGPKGLVLSVSSLATIEVHAIIPLGSSKQLEAAALAFLQRLVLFVF